MASLKALPRVSRDALDTYLQPKTGKVSCECEKDSLSMKMHDGKYQCDRQEEQGNAVMMRCTNQARTYGTLQC